MESKRALHLVHRCAVDRGPEAWEEFVRRYGRRLAAGVERALNRSGVHLPGAGREDLVQEVYCRLLEGQGRRLRRCRAEDERGVAGYLSRVAESVALDRLRAAAAAKRGGWTSPGSLDAPLQEKLVDLSGGPEELLLHRERRYDFLRRCLGAVGSRTTHRDLRVVYLALFEGWSSREISHKLGHTLAPSGIDSLLHRFKRRLAARGVRLPRRNHRPGAE